MSDLVFHAFLVATNGDTRPDSDPILGDRRTRKQLKRAVGRAPVAALGTRPTAGLYFASLRLWAAANLPQVQQALGVEGPDTYETLLGLVVADVWPEYDSLVPDLTAISSEYFFAFSRNDTAAVMSSLRVFLERVWSGVNPEVLMPAHLLLVGEMTYAKGMDRAIANADQPWSEAPAGWHNPKNSAPTSSHTERGVMHQGAGWDANDERSTAPTLGAPGDQTPVASALEGDAALGILLGEAVEVEDQDTRVLVDLALHFGFSLSDRLAADVGIGLEGSWTERVVTIGYCAALPALADAFDNDELLSAPVLVDLARRVDALSGDGELIRILASGDPERLLADAAVRLKAAFTDAGVSVPDAALALFPIRLAASAEMARRAVDNGS